VTLAYGKVILFGEHAVVYGRPALAAGLDAGVRLEAVVPRPRGARLRVAGWGLEADEDSPGALGAALKRLTELVPGPGFEASLGVELPLGAGLGGSAALSVALVRALAAARGESLPAARVRELAHELEKVFHGTPSGLDDTVATHGGLCLFYRDGLPPGAPWPASAEPLGAQSARLPFELPSLVIGQTGVPRATRDMLAGVRRRWETDRAGTDRLFERIECCLRLGLEALPGRDFAAFGRAMLDNQACLGELGVSIPEIERMVSLALGAGALGAKLTGAGGGGGVIALAPGREAAVAEAWTRAGFSTFTTCLGVPRRPPETRSSGEGRACSSSRLRGLHALSLSERCRLVASAVGLPPESLTRRLRDGLPMELAERLVENVLGIHALPFAVAPNFLIDGRERVVPMVTEEPSVVAAAAHGARLAREGGGFLVEVERPVMIGQVQVYTPEPAVAVARVQAARDELVRLAAAQDPRLAEAGGGPLEIEVRSFEPQVEGDEAFVVAHLHVDVRDAMGANAVNTMAEALMPRLLELTGGRPGLCILSNLADRRLVRARARVPAAALAGGGRAGEEVARGIAAASRFAERDAYRAVTHNKGIMNGVDALLLATGNDFRAVEAGAHAWAARDGGYRPLCTWRLEGDALAGWLEMPMAVGVVGGAARAHPGARLALELLGARTAAELAAAAAAVGMANNLAALRALSGEGIQRGHMRLHRRGRPA
jgi:hydroxymethylglutaryl-CoA reductase